MFKQKNKTAPKACRNILNSRYYGKESREENSYFYSISETDLFILDDLGAEFKSLFNKSAIFEIINTRTSLKKPIIINTNLTPTDIEQTYGQRVF